ncbi:hypothetical protein NA57DRAFT_72872 [Rhizodiscina lignyota]|uniref:Uncharacterized protein n=1 Tax=Rhizodiscina lignyota TaxID=1504668 RepID=A0A9P4ILH4_9PEZI|nr:hypothetical protein NA57DRAFT_72872 [Rhizodiscina lignyota]
MDGFDFNPDLLQKLQDLPEWGFDQATEGQPDTNQNADLEGTGCASVSTEISTKRVRDETADNEEQLAPPDLKSSKSGQLVTADDLILDAINDISEEEWAAILNNPGPNNELDTHDSSPEAQVGATAAFQAESDPSAPAGTLFTPIRLLEHSHLLSGANAVPAPHQYAPPPQLLSAATVAVPQPLNNTQVVDSKVYKLVLPNREVAAQAAQNRAYLPTPSPTPGPVQYSTLSLPALPNEFVQAAPIPPSVRRSPFEVATPGWADLRLIKTVITADEILAYLPEHLKVYDCLFRLIYNGFSQCDIAGACNFFRGAEFEGAMLQNTITKRMKSIEAARHQETGMNGGQPFKGNKERKMQHLQWPYFDTEKWGAPPRTTLKDFPLAGLANGLVVRPWGEGRGPLSKSIEYAEMHPELNLMLSNVPAIMASQGFKPIEPAGCNIDKKARERLTPYISKRGMRYPERRTDRTDKVNLRKKN